MPYDENRVRITNDKDNKFGYVNASHISATVGNSQRFYIAAQGPLTNTVHNFWAMVQECDVHLIVMLTEVSGANKTSACIPYWPQNDGSSLEIGEFTITKVCEKLHEMKKFKYSYFVFIRCSAPSLVVTEPQHCS